MGRSGASRVALERWCGWLVLLSWAEVRGSPPAPCWPKGMKRRHTDLNAVGASVRMTVVRDSGRHDTSPELEPNSDSGPVSVSILSLVSGRFVATRRMLKDGDLYRGDSRAGESYGLGCGLGEVYVAPVHVRTPGVDSYHGRVPAIAYA